MKSLLTQPKKKNSALLPRIELRPFSHYTITIRTCAIAAQTAIIYSGTVTDKLQVLEGRYCCLL